MFGAWALMWLKAPKWKPDTGGGRLNVPKFHPAWDMQDTPT